MRLVGVGELQPNVSPSFELVGIIESSDVYTVPSTETILPVNVVPEHDDVALATIWLRIRKSPGPQSTNLVPVQNVLKPPIVSSTQQIATTCRLPGHTGVGQLLLLRAVKRAENRKCEQV